MPPAWRAGAKRKFPRDTEQDNATVSRGRLEEDEFPSGFQWTLAARALHAETEREGGKEASPLRERATKGENQPEKNEGQGEVQQ